MPHPLTRLPDPIYWNLRNVFNQVYKRVKPLPRTNIYERDWDLLLVLDACRPDLLSEVTEEYDFVPPQFDTIYSVGSSSKEWLRKTFDAEYEQEVQQTGLVTANVHSNTCLDSSRFAYCYEVWKSEWDDELSTIPPRAVTDTLIKATRENDIPRVIGHYMQPHFPSIVHPSFADGFSRTETGWVWDDMSVWNKLRTGQLGFEEIWSEYKANLRAVLDEISLLLQNLEAETVILTSDHGNAIGEWGYYDHPGYHGFPFLLEVPWVETKAQDTGSYTPDIKLEFDSISTDEREERMRKLGYLS